MNIIIKTINDHLTKQGIPNTLQSPQHDHQFPFHNSHLTVHHPSKIVYIGVTNNTCQIVYWQDLGFDTVEIPLAHPQLYQKITQQLRKILQ